MNMNTTCYLAEHFVLFEMAGIVLTAAQVRRLQGALHGSALRQVLLSFLCWNVSV